MSTKTKQASNAYSIALRKEGASDPDLSRRLQVHLMSDIQDRWEGMSETVEIWGPNPNVQFVSKFLIDPSVRLRVANLFVRRETVRVVEDILKGVRQLKPSDVSTTKEHVVSTLRALPNMSEQAISVAADLLMPVFISKGMVNNNVSYAQHVRYGFGRTDLEDVSIDVAMHQVSEAIEAAKASTIDPNTKYSVKPLAEAFGESLRQIGLAILDVNELNPIIDDMVKGVRAHLDPSGAVTADAGSVPKYWRDHPVVEELAKNLVFIRAALRLPESTRLTLSSESWRLEKWAPIILAAIKSSSRYAWIGKAEALRHYSLFKVRDNSGMVVSSVLARDMKVQAVAQTVFAVKDAIMPSATNINATKDRVAEAIQMAYGSSDFSVGAAAMTFLDILTDGVEAGWLGYDSLYSFGAPTRAGDIKEHHAADIAALVSERLYVELDANGIVMDQPSRRWLETITAKRNVKIEDADGGEDGSPAPTAEDIEAAEAHLEQWNRMWRPKWWFVVKTTEKNLRVWSGVHHGSEVITSDPAEALMAAETFDRVDALPARAQVLGPKAFSSRIIDFDIGTLLQRLKNNFKFEVTVNNVSMRGTLSAQDFGSLKSGVYTSLVVPNFNAEVINQTRTVMEYTKSIIDQMKSNKGKANAWLQNALPGDPFFTYVERRLARQLLDMAQKLSPMFRTDVHRAVVERSVMSSKTSGRPAIGVDEAMTLRAQLHQKTFAACADLVSLQFFFDLQGIDQTGWSEIVNSEELMRICMEQGSDRDMLL